MATSELAHEYIIVMGNQTSKPFACDFNEARQALQEFKKSHAQPGTLKRRLTTPFKEIIFDDEVLNTQRGTL
jgi:hypothetical protein